MALVRADIVRALDELISQEAGMRFQGLAVALGKRRWPELTAHQRKKDFGLDAYASSTETSDGIGKGLAASITPTLTKLGSDARTAKQNFPDLEALLFVTPAKVGNADRRRWEQAIYDTHGVRLTLIEREEIITQMLMPEHASLCVSHLYLQLDAEPQLADILDRTRRAADVAARHWARRTGGHPLVDLDAIRLEPSGADSSDVLSVEQIDELLSHCGRIVLEGTAGSGKTTTLIQLAQRPRAAGLAILVDLPAWTSSRRGILEYVAGMPEFRAEGLTADDLARLQQTEPLLILLNGWNEIADTGSTQANVSLRDLERTFPRAGIIVATRTHHLSPPLPGAVRLRLLRLRREQRQDYLTNRLGERAAELRTRIDADPSLDTATRTPLILSGVASLFESGIEIPSTRVGVLAQVLDLHEQQEEHRNFLQAAPTFGRHADYLVALAFEMTGRGAVSLTDADARAVAAEVSRGLVNRGQIEQAGGPGILATLTAHHVLERIDYPRAAVQFAHHQFQEFYASRNLYARLFDLRDDDGEAIDRFLADYVNDPAWAEALRLVAETLGGASDNVDDDVRRSGQTLVQMALSVELVFAAELAQLCGSVAWRETAAVVGERLRGVYAMSAAGFRNHSLAAMVATGSDEFRDVVVPLLSGEDEQARLRTLRLWPDIQVSSLGADWRETLRGWSEEARATFVSEMLHNRVDDALAAFAANDDSAAVKRSAAHGLMWNRSDEALVVVLKSMDTDTFEEVARQNADLMPDALRVETTDALRTFIENSTDHHAILRSALALIELGETGLDDVVKEAMTGLPDDGTSDPGSRYIRRALEYLAETDNVWVSEWVATQVVENRRWGHEAFLQYATTIPDHVIESCLQRIEDEHPGPRHVEGMIAVIALRADQALAARVFSALRELWRRIDAEPDVSHEAEWRRIDRLRSVLCGLTHDIAIAGILSSVTNGDTLDIKVTTDVLSRVARHDKEPLHIDDAELKSNFRDYLKTGVNLVLQEDDFTGKEKANLASVLSQIGEAEDVADLVRLIRADIERMRRGRAAHAAGDRGPAANGGCVCYARWQVAALTDLDSARAERALIELLPEPEYLSAVAAAMAHDFVPKPEHPFGRTFRYDLVWASREGRAVELGDETRRSRFATALNAEVSRLLDQAQDATRAPGLRVLATALAAVDPQGSTAVVLDAIALEGRWDEYIRLDAAERLLMAGIILPAPIAFAMVDSILARTQQWMSDSDRQLLSNTLRVCPFVDDIEAAIAKIRDVLEQRRLRGHELREIITALGECRSAIAVDLLFELASDDPTFQQCEGELLTAFATLDTTRSREILLGLIDTESPSITPTHRDRHETTLIAQLAEIAHRDPDVAGRLRELCEHDLPDFNRHILSRVMDSLGTPEALTSNLSLLDDTKPIPWGVREQLERAFVERRPSGQDTGFFTQHARASNGLRDRLFSMATHDEKRRKSALALLGQIEEWRLEHGRPWDEPRHPDLASGHPWPPIEPS